MNVFKSEIGTEINIDAITSVAIICDEYGATIQESGKIHYSWYRVCVKDKDKDVSGGYGDEAAGWITIDDFSKLKPVLLKQGWLFHRSRTGAPWYAEGEAGARPSKACVSDRASVHDSAIGESFLPLPLVNVSVLDLDDHKAAIQELIEGRIDSARHILQRVRERYPRDLQVYKRLARLEIAQRDWNEAVYSIMMWLELLVYEIRQNKDRGRYELGARRNLRKLEELIEIRIKEYAIPTHRILYLLESTLEDTDAALPASVDKEPIIMLGYCYCMLFPHDVSTYCFSPQKFENYRLLQSGRPAGSDFRGGREETIVYGIGLLMVLANVKGDLKSLEKEALYRRWDRRPSYAVYTQTVENAKAIRDKWMQKILEFTANDVRRHLNCNAIPRFAVHIEDMLANDAKYGKTITVMLGATGQPLTSVKCLCIHTPEEMAAKLEDLRAVGDVYGMQFEVEVDEGDYICSPTHGDVADEQLAEWLSKRLNRNIYCGGTRRGDGRYFRLFSYFDIIQI